MKHTIILLSMFLFSSGAFAKPTTLAILSIEDKSATSLNGDCDLVGIWATPGVAIRELLTDELSKLSDLDLVDRDVIKEIYENEFEQPNMENKAIRGKFLAADYVLAGAVSEFESCVSNSDTKLDIGGLLGIGGLEVGSRSSKSHVALDLRLIEVKTGKIVKTFRATGRVENEGGSLALEILGNRLNREAFEKVPLGQATKLAVTEASAKVAAILKK